MIRTEFFDALNCLNCKLSFPNNLRISPNGTINIINIIDKTIFEIKNPSKFEKVNQNIAIGCNNEGSNIVNNIIGIVNLKNNIFSVSNPIIRNININANPVSFFCCSVILTGIIFFLSSVIVLFLILECNAEREGFEPSVPFQAEHSLSRRAPSASSATSPIYNLLKI